MATPKRKPLVPVTSALQEVRDLLLPHTVPAALGIVYLAWVVWTPHNRFSILEDIAFERILALALLVAAVSSRVPLRVNGTIFGVLIVFCVYSYALYLFPGRANSNMANVWAQQYWKDIVLILLFCCVMSHEKDSWRVPIFLAAVICAYQLYTLIDYFRGGSYVYQQGTKRLVGVWTSRSYGSANEMAKWSLIAVSCLLPHLSKEMPKAIRRIALFGLGVALLTLLLTGSRASLLVVLVLLALWFRTKLLNLKLIALVALAATLAWGLLPETLKERYLGIASLRQVHEGDADLDVSEQSALGRLEGLKDGFAIWRHHPVFGVGPGNSAIVRAALRPDDSVVNLEGGSALGLHSMYGQVLSETGAIGTVLFVLLFAISVRKCLSINVGANETNPRRIAASQATALSLVAMLGFGFASHNLYQDVWLILFASAALLAGPLDGHRSTFAQTPTRRTPSSTRPASRR